MATIVAFPSPRLPVPVAVAFARQTQYPAYTVRTLAGHLDPHAVAAGALAPALAVGHLAADADPFRGAPIQARVEA